MESFEDFVLKMETIVFLMNIYRFMSRRDQGHCLTLDLGLTII